MTGDVVLVDRSGAVARVTLNRPTRLNALDGEMIERLLGVLAHLDADAGIRALVLTGAGRGFCAGADVGDIARAAGEDAAGSVADVRRMIRTGSERLAMALLELETPVVAAVNGPCAGAGVGIALCADFLVARSDARFSVAFTRRGLVPDYATTFLLPGSSACGRHAGSHSWGRPSPHSRPPRRDWCTRWWRRRSSTARWRRSRAGSPRGRRSRWG